MFHLQTTVPDWPRAVEKLPAGALVKSVQDQHVLVEAKRANPGVYTCLRYWNDALQHYDGGWYDWQVALSRARIWFDQFIDGTFRDQIAPFCDSVQFHNEVWAGSQTAYERGERNAANEAAAWVWNTEFRQTFDNDIRLVLSTAAIGNDLDRDVAVLALEEDCIVGYHPYSYWSNVGGGEYVRAANDWVDLSGRWETMEKAWGLKPDWIFPEAGPFESAVTGWRSDECLGNSKDRYVNAVREWILDAQETEAYKEGRLYGFALFTTGRTNDVWKGFWTEQPELDALADMIAVEWHPGETPPEPPPEPPPSNGVPYTVIVNLLAQNATLEQKFDVIERVHEAKETILQSADDAARLTEPGKPGSVVKVWDAGQWDDDIVEWLFDHGAPRVDLLEYTDDPPAFEIQDIVYELPVHETKVYDERPITDITTLTIHHTVSPPDRSIESIAAYHVDTRGYPGIAYHYVLDDKGGVFLTNYLETKSYHAGSYNAPGDENYWSVGIALQGDFTNGPPPQAQLDAAAALVDFLRDYLEPVELDVLGHRQMPGAQTQCPGNSYQEWIDYIIG